LFRLQKEGRPLDTPAGRGLDKRYVVTLREAIDQNLTKDETLDYFRSKWGATEAALTALGGPKPSKFLQDKTIINKWAQMRRARQSADHGQATQSKQRSTQSSTQAERAPKRKRHRLDPRYVATLQEALEQSLTTMDALHFFREKWGQTEADWSAMPGDKPASFPDDKQLKTKLA
ncbi:Hypothetical Protein FCC1311_116332, partial [Hondaea fermentalgiana]